MSAGQVWLLGFWFGGVVACAAQFAIDAIRAGGLQSAVPPGARLHPVRFGLAALALVVVWPAGLTLIWGLARQQRAQQAADAAEHERIEATRQPAETYEYGFFCPATGTYCVRNDCVGSNCALFEGCPERHAFIAPGSWCSKCGERRPLA